MLFGPGGPDVPEPDYQGCSNDHAEFWLPDDEYTIDIVVDGGPANDSCNELFFHGGGGGQGGAVFHLEPRLRMMGDRDVGDASVTWEVYDLDGSGGPIVAQGFEIYTEDLTQIEGGVEHRARVLIGPDERGKNLRIVAILTLPNVEGAAAVRAEAAAYVSGPVP